MDGIDSGLNFVDILVGGAAVVNLSIGRVPPCGGLHFNVAALNILGHEKGRVLYGGVGIL